MNYDTVLFDFDGTLAETAEDVWDSVAFAARQAGAELPVDIRTDAANLVLSPSALFHLLRPTLGGALLATFESELTRHYRTVNRHPNTCLYPGVKEMLSALRERGVPMHIVTAKEAGALARLLALKGWRHWFGQCLSPDSFADGRRTKTQLLGALLRYLPSGGRTVYVGDSAPDVAAARANGIPCIAACYGDNDNEALLAEKPDFTVQSAWEILPLLMGEAHRDFLDDG